MGDDSAADDRRVKRRVVYQRRLAGLPSAAAFSASNGIAVLLGVTRQLIGEAWLGAHGFQFCGSIGPLPIHENVEHSIKQIGQALTDRFELAGAFGVDFILDGERVWIVEVNPRYTASMEVCERVSGNNTIASHVSEWRNLRPPQCQSVQRTEQRAHGKAILFGRRDIRISHEFAEMSLAEALPLQWPTLADVSPAGTMIEAGRPILTLFAEGSHVDQVEHRLRERAAEFERHLYGGDAL
jgi:predicted ATP-grasp superfamily ATP-dependent carboligase